MLVLTLVLSSDGVDTHVWIRTCEILADTLCFFLSRTPKQGCDAVINKKKTVPI